MRISITNYSAASILTSKMDTLIFKTGTDTSIQFKQSDPNVGLSIALNPDEVEQFIKNLLTVNPDIKDSLYVQWYKEIYDTVRSIYPSVSSVS